MTRLKRVFIVAMLDSFADLACITEFIIKQDDGLANWVNKFRIHCVLKPAPPAPTSLVTQSYSACFANADLAGKQLLDFHIDPLHKAPAFGDGISLIFFHCRQCLQYK